MSLIGFTTVARARADGECQDDPETVIAAPMWCRLGAPGPVTMTSVGLVATLGTDMTAFRTEWHGGCTLVDAMAFDIRTKANVAGQLRTTARVDER